MKTKGLIFVIFACIFWGMIGVFNSGLNKAGFESMTLAAWRCIISAIALWIYVLITKKGKVKITFKQLLATAGEGISFFLMALAYFVSINKTSAATASVLLTTAPVMVMAFSVIFWHERLTLIKVLSVFVSLIGCAFMAGLGADTKFSAIGIILALLAAVAYAGYSIFTKMSLKLGVDSELNIAYSFLFSALAALLCTSPVKNINALASSDFKSIILLIGMAVVTGALAGLMYTKGMKLLPAGVTAAFAALEPLVSTTMSVVFLNERLSFTMVLGIIMILSAVTALSLEGSKSKQ